MIIERPAGSYLQKEDGSLEPDLDDEATRERLQLKVGAGMPARTKTKEVKADADTRK